MKKIIRNTSTPEAKEFWQKVVESTSSQAPSWKRAGINVATLRGESRILGEDSVGEDSR